MNPLTRTQMKNIMGGTEPADGPCANREEDEVMCCDDGRKDKCKNLIGHCSWIGGSDGTGCPES
jgi:hypothetical protein